MTTMIEDAVAKCRAGVTSAAEVLRVTTVDGMSPMAELSSYRGDPDGRSRRNRHRLDRGADRGRSRAPHRISRPRAGRHRHGGARRARADSLFTLTQRAKPEDVTVFTLDLALLLKAGARLDDALELLASDTDVGGLRPMVATFRAAILSGESFGEALARHPSLFPPMYVALVRVGEASGTLDRNP